MAERSDPYGTARIPPATPPTIQPDADPLDASELAQDDGDSAADGHAPFDGAQEKSEIDKERETALKDGDRHAGKGELSLDALPAD